MKEKKKADKTMRILMLGNSFTTTNHMPEMLADLTGAEVVVHARGGARLAEHLNPKTKMGKRTQEALTQEKWDYVVLQEMSNGPITAKARFLDSTRNLCEQIRLNGANPILYATWAYQCGSEALKRLGMSYEEMYQEMIDAYRQAAEKTQALLADVGTQFYKKADIEKLYAADGCHPSKLGSEIAARKIAENIRSM